MEKDLMLSLFSDGIETCCIASHLPTRRCDLALHYFPRGPPNLSSYVFSKTWSHHFYIIEERDKITTIYLMNLEPVCVHILFQEQQEVHISEKFELGGLLEVQLRPLT
jgi:hypothetical protein